MTLDEDRANRAAAGAQVNPSILHYLKDLDSAAAQIVDTWRPDDPRYLADVHRQIMMNLSYAYFVYFHADAEHPDWAPLWNPVYTCQPNPDDIYVYSPIRGDLSYRVSGNRGTVKKLIFVTQKGFVGMIDNVTASVSEVNMIDEHDFEVGPDGEFEILFSTERPAGHRGNWAPVGPNADLIYVRYRIWDWEAERDPQLSIECLDPVPLKARLSVEQVLERLKEMAKFPARANALFYDMQNQVKAKVGVNRFAADRYAGLGHKQVYLPAVFELTPGEALIIETELPERADYWNFQLDDPYFNAVEYVYRLGSINGASAHISSDGKFRAVIALEDPGTPNWLDPAGFTEGTIYGRWYDCSSYPTPEIKRVPLDALRSHLPPDTPQVTPEQRAEQIRRRVRAAQRRRRW